MTRSLELVEMMEAKFVKKPFNTAFGMYLYLEKGARTIFQEPGELLRQVISEGIRNYDVYKLLENVSPQVMQEIESEHVKVDSKYRSIFLKFIHEVTSKLKHKQDLETSILKLLKSVNHNNIAQVKKYVGGKEYTIPRVAMKTLYGYEDEQGVKLEIESSK